MSCTIGGPFLKGSRPTARFTFEEVITGDPIDPTNIKVITRSPAGTEVTYNKPHATIYQDTPAVVGEWFFTFPVGLTATGKWFVYVDGDGGVQEAEFTITGVHVTV